jgi:putative hemolysin
VGSVWPELLLVFGLVVMNGVLAGSEIALISLRESQMARLERRGGSGKVVARLARDPNRFLATIQIGITLAGFLASAAAAVTLSEPLVPYLDFLGAAARTVAIVVVTLILSFVTLVFGELVPKRLALQRAERWAVVVGRPLHWLAVATTPVVWLLSVSTDAVVRLLGGEPGSTREEIDLEELREMVVANRAMHEDHQEVLLGAFEVAERTVGEVLVPRPDVFTLDEAMTASTGCRRWSIPATPAIPVVSAGKRARWGDRHRQPPRSRGGRSGHLGPRAMPPRHWSSPSRCRSWPPYAACRRPVSRWPSWWTSSGGSRGSSRSRTSSRSWSGRSTTSPIGTSSPPGGGPTGAWSSPGRFPVHDLVDLGIEIPRGRLPDGGRVRPRPAGEDPQGAGRRNRGGTVAGDRADPRPAEDRRGEVSAGWPPLRHRRLTAPRGAGEAPPVPSIDIVPQRFVAEGQGLPFAAAMRGVRARGYTGEDLRADLGAGLTLGVVALPLSMALAIASGALPQLGLFTAIVGGAVIARGVDPLVSGPTAAFVVVLAPIVRTGSPACCWRACWQVGAGGHLRGWASSSNSPAPRWPPDSPSVSTW